MKNIFFELDRGFGINKLRQMIEEGEIQIRKPNNLVHRLAHNTMKAMTIFCSIASFLLGFAFIVSFMLEKSVGDLMMAFFSIFLHIIMLWFFRFFCMLERVGAK